MVQNSTDDAEVDSLRAELAALTPDPRKVDDHKALIVAQLALDAIADGNHPVGAIITNDAGEVVARSANAVFADGFRSSAHAEMLTLDAFEQNPPCAPREAHMFVLLEPCPMCTGRLLYSGLRSVTYVVDDKDGGMLRHMRRMPPAWRNLAALQEHHRAILSPAVADTCQRIVKASPADIRQRWRDAVGVGLRN